MKKRTAILMARVSSDEQAKGYSLDIQTELINKWCSINNVEIIRSFREDHSAKDFNRPQWKELKAYARANQSMIDLLLVTTWDRFSRNTMDAFNELSAFRNMGIEVQSIQQPIDFAIPESKVLLAIYLTLPEVDNDRRSMKIREGIRAALKSGRWSRNAPIGYRNTRDDFNKPLIIPCEKSTLIELAFSEIASGKSQEEVRHMIYRKGLTISRNNISKLLRNVVYIGKVKVPASDTEPAQIIDGIHAGIIELNTFAKVQEILHGRVSKKNAPKRNADKEELPLRGILHCSKCSSKLTGSASKSATGAKHYYYHCNSCKEERFKAKNANVCIEQFLSTLQFDDAPKKIYQDILYTIAQEKIVKTAKESNTDQNKIVQLKLRVDRLQDLLIDNVLSPEEYSAKKKQIQQELNQLEAGLKNDVENVKEIHSKIKNGINLLVDAKAVYVKASIPDKQKLISSIFPEKLQFSENKCRTFRINDLLLLMLSKNNNLEKLKKGQLNNFIELSPVVESGRAQ